MIASPTREGPGVVTRVLPTNQKETAGEENRGHRVPPHPIGPLSVGLLSPQDENSGDGHPVEDPGGEDDVGEELVVRAGSREDRSPDALEEEREARRLEAGMDLGDSGEEQSVARLGEVHPRRGEDGPVRRADDRKQDRERDEGSPECAEGALGDGRGDPLVSRRSLRERGPSGTRRSRSGRWP